MIWALARVPTTDANTGRLDSAHARFMFNYVMSSVEDHEGEELGRANAFTMRTQFDF